MSQLSFFPLWFFSEAFHNGLCLCVFLLSALPQLICSFNHFFFSSHTLTAKIIFKCLIHFYVFCLWASGSESDLLINTTLHFSPCLVREGCSLTTNAFNFYSVFIIFKVFLLYEVVLLNIPTMKYKIVLS